VLPKLGREEESSMDREAFPELKAPLSSAIPLSGTFQTVRGNSLSEEGKGVHNASL